MKLPFKSEKNRRTVSAYAQDANSLGNPLWEKVKMSNAHVCQRKRSCEGVIFI